jgi:hypothetical protein
MNDPRTVGSPTEIRTIHLRTEVYSVTAKAVFGRRKQVGRIGQKMLLVGVSH